jgi:deoxyribodipyrimidine photo-lyase
MTAFRRLEWNWALQHAVARAGELGRPLVILEALRADYRWASDRAHRFILEGMAQHARQLRVGPVGYYPFVERAAGEGAGLVEALAGHACVTVGDDWPGFFHPRMLDAAAARIPGRLEVVDSCGLVPVRATGRAFATAYAFRRYLQQTLPEHLCSLPARDPLASSVPVPAARVPPAILDRWPAATLEWLRRADLSALPIDHGVPAADSAGGSEAGRKRLGSFLRGGLGRYAEERSAPEADAASGLSPYLHFGHISPHEVLFRIGQAEDWSPGRLGPKAHGKRTGWWGMGPNAEAFLDQLVTWRELGLNAAVNLPYYEGYESLPAWARSTLEAHEADRRPHRYDLDVLDAAGTHDPLWNAAQRQLRREGTIQNYLRMVWGKKILEWSASPRMAAEAMIELNNRYALDGRDPNSYSGIYWCLGRYDRPWGPERPIFGTVRYMSSANTARKFSLRAYLERYAR